MDWLYEVVIKASRKRSFPIFRLTIACEGDHKRHRLGSFFPQLFDDCVTVHPGKPNIA